MVEEFREDVDSREPEFMIVLVCRGLLAVHGHVVLSPQFAARLMSTRLTIHQTHLAWLTEKAHT